MLFERVVHRTPVGLSVFDPESKVGIDIYRSNPEIYDGIWGEHDLLRLLRLLMEESRDIANARLAVWEGDAVEPPMWRGGGQLRNVLSQDMAEVFRGREDLFRGLRYREVKIGEYAIRLTFKPKEPYAALRVTEDLLREKAQTTEEERTLLYTVLVLATVLAMLSPQGIGKTDRKRQEWLVIALWVAGILGYRIGEWAVEHPESTSGKKYKALVRGVVGAVKQGRPIRMPEARVVDVVRAFVAAGEAAWTPQAINRWRERAGMGFVVPHDAEEGDAPLDLEVAATLWLALQGVSKGEVKIPVPLVDGRVRLLRVFPGQHVAMDYGQVLELAWGEISDRALTWLAGDEFPVKGGVDVSEPSVISPDTDTPVQENLLRQLALRAVREAREKQRYVPSGQSFLLGLSGIAPQALQSAGVEALAVWADAGGVWARIIAPGRFSDGIIFRWRPVEQTDGRMNPQFMSEWARAVFDVICAMLWRDLVVAQESVQFTEQNEGRRRRRRKRSAESEFTPAAPSARVRRLPRRYARKARWVRWGTPEEHRAIRSPHWVMGHIRRLPKGRIRSKAAERLAEDYGVLLPEDKGVTFVRPYIRGGEGEVPGTLEAPKVHSRGLMTLLSLFREEKT